MKGAKRFVSIVLLNTLLLTSNSVWLLQITSAYTWESSTWTVLEWEWQAICYNNKTYYLDSDSEMLEEFVNLGGKLGECWSEVNEISEIKDERLKTNGKDDKSLNAKDKREELLTWSTEPTSKKITICHNWKTLEISQNALSSHLQHNDTIWACNENSEKKDESWKKKESGCQRIDQYGRSKWDAKNNNGWYKDVIKWEEIELYKICSDSWEEAKNNKKVYTLEKPHPWCAKINEQIKKRQEKGFTPKWIMMKIFNCEHYHTPYPQKISIPWLEELEEKLKATGSVQVNNDNLFTEDQNVMLTLSPTEQPIQIRVSIDNTNWTDWKSYEPVIPYIIENNTSGIKKIYVQYDYWTNTETEYDAIILAPKYDAEYSILSPSPVGEGARGWSYTEPQYQSNKNYKFTIKAINKGSLTWNPSDPQYPVQLRYKILDNSNQEITTQTTNFWILPQETPYLHSTEIPIIVHLPENYTWTAKIVFSLEHWGQTDFEQVWVEPLVQNITIQPSEEVQRQKLINTQSLPMGIWEYTSLENQPIPDVATVCQSREMLYHLNDAQDTFTIQYSVPFWRSIHTPHIYDIRTDVDDSTTAFYELDYSEYVNDNEKYYLYYDSAEESELCAIERDQFPTARPCDEIYPDTQNISDSQCIDLAKATSRKWMSWYKDGSFEPLNPVNRVEFAKMITWAASLPLSEYNMSIPDVIATEWYATYVQAVLQQWAMSLTNWNFYPADYVNFEDAVEMVMKTFNFNIQNECNYTQIYPTNWYIWAALFYWIIGKGDIKTGDVDRITATSMMVVAESQKANLSSSTQVCPNSKEDKFQNEIRQICWEDKPVTLSTTSDLEENGMTLTNWTQVEILSESTTVTKVKEISTGTIGYVLNTQLTDNCTIPTPVEPLNTPTGKQVVISSPVWIYGHILANVTSEIFDYNKDGESNKNDVIPYNTVLEVLKTEWNWFYVQLPDQRTAWIFNGFVITWPEVPVDITTPKETATISWAHNMTVDLRTNTSTISRILNSDNNAINRYSNYHVNNILWETYEDTKVQIVDRDESNELYLVKIESTQKDISEEVFSQNYARLYPNFSAEDLKSLQKWVTWWVHKDFVKVDNVDYTTQQTLNYPFDYDKLKTLNRTTDQLVTQIYLEEFNSSIHSWIDFNLKKWEEVKSVANWVVDKVEKTTVTVKHDDWKISIYAHILPEIEEWDKVFVWTKLWEVSWSTPSYKSHLHFTLIDENWRELNPSKYFKVYNKNDSHKCVRELIVWEGVYDGEIVKKRCDVWIWLQDTPDTPEPGITRCLIDEVDCETNPWKCVWHFWVVNEYFRKNIDFYYPSDFWEKYKYYEYIDFRSELSRKNLEPIDSFIVKEEYNEFEITGFAMTSAKTYLEVRFIWTESRAYIDAKDIYEKWDMFKRIELVPFLDVNDYYGSDYCNEIKYWKENKWINGNKDTKWKNWEKYELATGYLYPEAGLKREIALKIIINASLDYHKIDKSVLDKYDINKVSNSNTQKCLSELTDLEGLGLWKYACYAYINHIIDWNNKKFLPADDVSYAEAQKIIMNAFKFDKIENITGRFWNVMPAMTKAMLVYFVHDAKRYDLFDVREYWSCVIFSNEFWRHVLKEGVTVKSVENLYPEWWRGSNIQELSFKENQVINLFRGGARNTSECTRESIVKEAEKVWVNENDENVWFFSVWKWIDPWHAGLYFIYKGKEYLISFYPIVKSVYNKWVNKDDEDTFLKWERWHISWIENFAIFLDASKESEYLLEWYPTKFHIPRTYTYVKTRFLNIEKLYNWYSNYKNKIASGNYYYEVLHNNCSTNVRDALFYSGFFKYFVVNINLTNTPDWLREDVEDELRLYYLYN